MYALQRIDLVPTMMAAGGVTVIPVGVPWLLHDALAGLSAGAHDRLAEVFGSLDDRPDPEIGRRFAAVDDSWSAWSDSPLLRVEGCGVTARWTVQPEALGTWRKGLMRLQPEAVQALAQAGQRLATAADTVLKNADTAAASWGASRTLGEILLPTDRKVVAVANR